MYVFAQDTIYNRNIGKQRISLHQFSSKTSLVPEIIFISKNMYDCVPYRWGTLANRPAGTHSVRLVQRQRLKADLAGWLVDRTQTQQSAWETGIQTEETKQKILKESIARVLTDETWIHGMKFNASRARLYYYKFWQMQRFREIKRFCLAHVPMVTPGGWGAWLQIALGST